MTFLPFGPRRFLFSFAAALICALVVFTLPRIVYGSVSRAIGQQAPAHDSTHAAAPPAAIAPVVQPQAPARVAMPVTLGMRLTGLIGVVMVIAIGWLVSHDRKAIDWRVIFTGLALQFIFGVFVLRVPFGQALFRKLGTFVTAVLGFSYAGSSFVFGKIGAPGGADTNIGVVFAFQILPAIIFVSALFAIMYYLGVMQVVVKAMAVVMNKLMKASGAESTNVAASIFMGQTEAPLTIRPFLPTLTRSELMTVMTAGMAHVSGSIMAAYIAFGVEARHLLTAVIMTAPGTIMMAKLIEPETAEPLTRGKVNISIPKTDVNVVDAASRGTSEGLHLMLNVIAMLISFIALVALVNGALGWVHGHIAWFPENMQTVLGWVGRPIALAIGVPSQDAGVIGGLIGTRSVLNEFIAFAQLGQLKSQLDPRSFTIASFALAGFANISSVGIQIGGIGALAPERKGDLARLGFRAMLAGTLANLMSATIAGLLL
ncbi:MAG TPA: nucleoside transporter C-terminal domain-containing protein [Gemmatimonadales bacterium]|jgi:CNT family concentrative nucleoside transporter